LKNFFNAENVRSPFFLNAKTWHYSYYKDCLLNEIFTIGKSFTISMKLRKTWADCPFMSIIAAQLKLYSLSFSYNQIKTKQISNISWRVSQMNVSSFKKDHHAWFLDLIFNKNSKATAKFFLEELSRSCRSQLKQ